MVNNCHLHTTGLDAVPTICGSVSWGHQVNLEALDEDWCVSEALNKDWCVSDTLNDDWCVSKPLGEHWRIGDTLVVLVTVCQNHEYVQRPSI
jgi:hypothetical protein